MIKYKKIAVGKNILEAVVFKLSKKNLIVIRGNKGYVMCGYLDLAAADKFKDVAVKITGVSTVKDAPAGEGFCPKQRGREKRDLPKPADKRCP
ncbi:MAG: DUF1805 domain-containing protein [Candidatus Omnitrophota bacterium]